MGVILHYWVLLCGKWQSLSRVSYSHRTPASGLPTWQHNKRSDVQGSQKCAYWWFLQREQLWFPQYERWELRKSLLFGRNSQKWSLAHLGAYVIIHCSIPAIAWNHPVWRVITEKWIFTLLSRMCCSLGLPRLPQLILLVSWKSFTAAFQPLLGLQWQPGIKIWQENTGRGAFEHVEEELAIAHPVEDYTAPE